MNSTLGSVVPLAMFRHQTKLWRSQDCTWKFEVEVFQVLCYWRSYPTPQNHPVRPSVGHGKALPINDARPVAVIVVDVTMVEVLMVGVTMVEVIVVKATIVDITMVGVSKLKVTMVKSQSSRSPWSKSRHGYGEVTRGLGGHYEVVTGRLRDGYGWVMRWLWDGSQRAPRFLVDQ